MDAFIKKILISCILTLFAISNVNALDLDNTYEDDDVSLILNGQGIRDKFFINLYVGGLYLKDKNSNAKQILEIDEPMNIRLHIISSLITSEKMENSTREGFENATGGKTAPLEEKIESFIAVFKEKIKENDVYDFLYLPTIGTKIYKNGNLITTIAGVDFKKGLFGIWLSEKPAQNSLKKGMLGL